jgi:hypothetical protein
MTEPFAKKVKGFLLKPSETFRATQAESLNSAFQYYVSLLIVFSVLMFLLIAVSIALSGSASPATGSAGPLSGVLGSRGSNLLNAFKPFLTTFILVLPFLLFMMGLFGIFLSGFQYHVFVLLFGGQKGLVQTVKTLMYAVTPVLLIGWIPFVSIIGGIWYLILIVIGIRENQEMTTRRAVLVVLVPVVLNLILLAVMFVAAGAFIHALTVLPA